VVVLQALLLLVIGVFVLPLFDLPQLDPGNHYVALFVLTATIALAATGYGILVGTIAGTQEQSSIFGSISVVILAAIGGVWVPEFMMNDIMQVVTKLSPLNWSLNGYYDIFLRNATLVDILPWLSALFVFFLGCVSIGWYMNGKKV
jgi:ABC-2 type transport system permease protein